jgi:hypothetical protein
MKRLRDALPVLLSVAGMAAATYGVYLWLGAALAWIIGGVLMVLAAYAIEP